MKLSISAVSAAADLTGFLSNATGATWTLTATDSGDSLAHKVTIRNDSATDHSAKTAVLTGTGPSGEVQTETVNLPAGSATVTSTEYFLTLTTVVPSATIGADTMDLGWAAASVSGWEYPNTKVSWSGLGIGCEVISGTPTYGVQVGFGGGAIDHATITGETTSQYGECTMPVGAIRLVFTAAGGVDLHAIQAGA
jgi:hypothetical protein